MRAWCTGRRDIRDFTLGRVANASLAESPAAAWRSDDKDSNEDTTATIVAHPDLTAKHKPPEFQLIVSNAERLGAANWAE